MIKCDSHHTIPNTTFPSITTLLDRSTYHKSANERAEIEIKIIVDDDLNPLKFVMSSKMEGCSDLYSG